FLGRALQGMPLPQRIRCPYRIFWGRMGLPTTNYGDDEMGYVKILCEDSYRRALALCKGTYQENLLRGIESLSGATLKGRAKQFWARYRASRENLLARMTEAGIPWREERGEHGKRILV